MPRIKAIHWRELPGVLRTRCGSETRTVEYRDDATDATCNNCVRLAKKDGAL